MVRGRLPRVSRALARKFVNDNDQDLGGPRANGGYRDDDDSSVLAYRHLAGATESQVVTAIVKHYYALAAAEDGRKACSMVLKSIAEGAPEDYGKFGPPYLRGGKTCPEIAKRLFVHLHAELAYPVTVTGVLADQNDEHAYVLLGSPKMPATYTTLVRRHGAWRMDTFLAGVMP